MPGSGSFKATPGGQRSERPAGSSPGRRLSLAPEPPRQQGLRPPPPGRSSSATIDQAPPVVISHDLSVTGIEAERLWELYITNLDPLSDFAVQKQHSDRNEMLELFANRKVVKIVGRQEGRPVALGIVTNSLEDVPEISPRFLRRRYPDYADRDAIYVGMYVVVDPAHRGISLFHRLYIELWQVVGKASGVLVFDTCEFNRQTFDVDNLAQRIASAFPNSTLTKVDRQTWYAAELPEALS